MNSFDPRINRLPTIASSLEKKPHDQGHTFEVFVQPKEGASFQHEGAVHATDIELAYILAKETYTRRFTCSSIFVVATSDVGVSSLTDANQNVYDTIPIIHVEGEKVSYEICHLLKRGNHHIHVGQVQAVTFEHALSQAKATLNTKTVLNIWAISTSKIRFTSSLEKDLWHTLPDKKFRDASFWRGGDKLKNFLDKKAS